jgi:hypothetical protein
VIKSFISAIELNVVNESYSFSLLLPGEGPGMRGKKGGFE